MDYGIWFFLGGFLLAAIGMSMILHRDTKTINSIQAIANSKNAEIVELKSKVGALESRSVSTNMVANDLIKDNLNLNTNLRNLKTDVDFFRQQVKAMNREKPTQKLEITIIETKPAPSIKPGANGIKSLIKGMEVGK